MATEDLEVLAEMVCCGVVTPDKLTSLGFRLRKGKTFSDVQLAVCLKPGQPPGDFERMVAHVEKNLGEIVERA